MTRVVPKRSTAPDAKVADVRTRLLAAKRQLNETFVACEEQVDAMLLAHVAGSNYLFVGDPGTGKTALANCFAKHFADAKYFMVQFSSFTTPEDVFGDLDIAAYKEGRRAFVTVGMLPTAEMALFDEAFEASDGMGNALLAMVNCGERKFRGKKTPLHCLGGTSNWPQLQARTKRIQALYDRWVLRVPVRPLTKEEVARMLTASDKVEDYAPECDISMDELRFVAQEVRRVQVEPWVEDELAALHDQLARPKSTSGGRALKGIAISPRRLTQLRKVLRASAWLRGPQCACPKRCDAKKQCPSPAMRVTIEDFAVARFVLWEDQADCEALQAALGAIDAEHVKRAVATIDAGRRAIREADKQPGFGQAAARAVSKKVHECAVEAREVFDGPRLTAAGRETVRENLVRLRVELEEFARKHPGLMDGDKTMTSEVSP